MIGILLFVPRFLKVVYENLTTVIGCCIAIALNSVNLMVFESDLSLNNINKLNLSSLYFCLVSVLAPRWRKSAKRKRKVGKDFLHSITLIVPPSNQAANLYVILLPV